MAATVLFALAQGVWLTAEFASERERQAERQAVQLREPVPPVLRQEADSAQRYLSFVRSQAEVVLKERIRERVDEAVAIATSIHRQAQGKVPPALVRTLVREGLRASRFFDGRGYYFIDDLNGNCVLLPTAPEREGSSLMDNRDDAGRYIMRELLRAVQQPGAAGYARYRWFAPHSTERMEEKITYVRLFPQAWAG
ncbi:MAG: cache domain-containing protein [Magnetospirillum sp.]|nr:cache domain-containing protein [Magnetospirillum sp.]